jgi:hypothetical protein
MASANFLVFKSVLLGSCGYWFTSLIIDEPIDFSALLICWVVHRRGTVVSRLELAQRSGGRGEDGFMHVGATVL